MWLRMTHSCYVQWDGEDDEEREAPRDQNRQGDERVLTRDVAVAVEESSADYERRANGEHQQIHFSTLHTFFFFFRFLKVLVTKKLLYRFLRVLRVGCLGFQLLLSLQLHFLELLKRKAPDWHEMWLAKLKLLLLLVEQISRSRENETDFLIGRR